MYEKVIIFLWILFFFFWLFQYISDTNHSPLLHHLDLYYSYSTIIHNRHPLSWLPCVQVGLEYAREVPNFPVPVQLIILRTWISIIPPPCLIAPCDHPSSV